MARSKKTTNSVPELDITKTGALSYSELQDLNKLYEQYKAAQYSPASSSSISLSPYSVDTGTDFGSSSYDPALASSYEVQHLDNIRGKEQGRLLKLGSAVANGVILVGTTFLEGTVGLLYGGIAGGINSEKGFWNTATGVWEGMWNNDVTNAIQDFQEEVQNNILPYYRTDESNSKAWYQNMFGSHFLDFWADGLVKNLGFTIGAVYSGSIWTKALKILPWLSKSGLAAKTVGSLFSALNEGAIEANNNYRETYKAKSAVIEQAYNEEYQKIQNSDMSNPQKYYLLSQLAERKNKELDRLNEECIRAGNLTMALNTPILAFDDFLTFGRMYSRGFDNAKNIAQDNLKKGAKASIRAEADRATAEAGNTIIQNTERVGGEYVWKEITKKQAALKGLRTGLREGNEEMLQAMAASTSANYYTYDDPDAYYKAVTDPLYKAKSMGFIDALAKGFMDSYGNMDKWEEGAIGFLTGMLGTPTFGSTFNSGADTYLGRGKAVGITGGFFGEMAQASEDNRRGKENVEWMNKLRARVGIESENLMQKMAFQDAMDGYAADDNKFDYKNMEDNDLFRMINAYLAAGRKQDLLAIVDTDFSSMSEEELKKTAAFMSPKDDQGNVIPGQAINPKGWQDNNGNLLPNSPIEARRMIAKLEAKRDKIKQGIEDYEASLELVRGASGKHIDQSEDEITELAWLHWKTKQFTHRIKEIAKENGDDLASIANTLNKKKDALIQEYEKLSEPESTEGKSAAETIVIQGRNATLESKRRGIAQNIENINSILAGINSLQMGEDATAFTAFLGSNSQYIKDLYDNAAYITSNYLGGYMSTTEFTGIVDNLRDIGRLSRARQQFSERFQEYLSDPRKQKKNRRSIDEENAQVSEAINRRSAADNARDTSNILESLLDGTMTRESAEERKKALKRGGTPIDMEKMNEIDDALNRADFRENMESAIAKAVENNEISEEEAANLNNIVDSAVRNAESMADISPDSSLFDINPNGEPVDDTAREQLMSLVEEVLKNAEQASNLSAGDQEPTSAETRATLMDEAEKEIERQEKEATKKAEAANKAAMKEVGKDPVAPPPAVINDNPKNEDKTPKKKEEEKKQIVRTKKDDIVDQAISFTLVQLNTTIDEDILQSAKASLPNLLTDIFSHTYDLITQDKPLTNVKKIEEVIKNSESYKEIQKLLKQDISLEAGIKVIFEELKLAYQEKEVLDEEAKKRAEKEKEVGPDTVGIPNTNTVPIISSPINRQSWTPQISEFIRGTKPLKSAKDGVSTEDAKKTGVKRKVLNKIEKALWEFYKSNNIFTNKGKVKEGDPIFFTTVEALNEQISKIQGKEAFVIVMADKEGNYVGTITIDAFDSYHDPQGRHEILTKHVKAEYEQWKKGDKSYPFKSSWSTECNQEMFGYVQTTENDRKHDSTLNEIFPSGRIIGIAVTDKKITTVAGNVAEPFKIRTPRTQFTPGTPVILVPTARGDEYIAMPFITPTFDKVSENSNFTMWAIDYLNEAINREKTNRGDNIWSALFDLFVLPKNLHINVNGNNHFTIKIKDGDLLYDKTLKDVTAEEILSVMKSLNAQIRVNRKFINTNIKKIPYNNIIGDIAYTNLPKDTTTTVDDWFSVFPLNEKGEKVGVPKMSLPSDRVQSSTTAKVLFNEKQYEVNEKGEITENGVPAVLKPRQEAIIKGLAEVNRRDTLAPVVPNTTWYRLDNGSLINIEADNEEILIGQEAENKIKELKGKSLGTKSSKDNKVPKDFVPSDKIPEGKEQVGMAIIANADNTFTPYQVYRDKDGKLSLMDEQGYYIGHDGTGNNLRRLNPEEVITPWTTDQIEALHPMEGWKFSNFDISTNLGNFTPTREWENAVETKLHKDLSSGRAAPVITRMQDSPKYAATISILKGLDSNQQKGVADFIKDQLRTVRDPKKVDLSKVEEEIMKRDNPKLRKVDEGHTPINLDDEINWLKKVLPQLTHDAAVRIVKGLIKMGDSSNPVTAWGMTQHGIITISDMAARGTVYHEAFHAVVDAFLNDEEIKRLFKEGSTVYNIDLDNEDAIIAIEEKLAEDFRRYIQKERKPVTGFFTRMFRSLKHVIKGWFGNESEIQQVFYNIARAKYADRKFNSKRNPLSKTFDFDNIDKSKVDIVRDTARKSRDGKHINDSIKIYLKDQHEKGYFELIKDNEPGYYSVHFKTATEQTGITTTSMGEKAIPSTYKERQILWEQLLNAIPEGARISTWGSLSENGIAALNKIGRIGNLKKVGEREVSKKESAGGGKVLIPIWQKGDTFQTAQDKAKASGAYTDEMNSIKEAAIKDGTFSRDNDDIRYRRAEGVFAKSDQELELEELMGRELTYGERLNNYYMRTTSFRNLTQDQRRVLEMNGVSEESYDYLNVAERENTRMCLL